MSKSLVLKSAVFIIILSFIHVCFAIPGDINEDGSVNAADINLMVDYWLEGNCAALPLAQQQDCFDTNLDGVEYVSLTDFSALADRWLETDTANYFRVDNFHDTPTFRNGMDWILIPAYDQTWPDTTRASHFAGKGTKMYDFIAFFAGNDYGWGSEGGGSNPDKYEPWVNLNTFDFSMFDNFMNTILAADPDALVMPRLSIGTPTWWLNDSANANEFEVMDDGMSLSIYFSRYSTQPDVLPYAGPFPSMASTKWRQDMGYALEQFLDHITAMGWDNRVVGFKFGFLSTGESYHWSGPRHELAGYSEPTRLAFSQWLRTKYNNDVNSLRISWNKPTVTFDNVQVPTRAERMAGDGQLTFRYPSQYMNVIDFLVFWNELIPDTFDYFASVIKNHSNRTKVVGAFYGFMYEFHGLTEFGHNGLGRYNKSPNLDFVLVTASYQNRQFVSGADCLRGPEYSVQLHDKVWYHDNDMSSPISVAKWQGWGFTPEKIDSELARTGGAYTYEDTAKMMRRVTGFCLCEGMYPNFFDLDGGTFENDLLFNEAQTMNNLCNRAKSDSLDSIAEILVVSDEVSCAYVPCWSPLTEENLKRSQPAYPKVGAPADHILLDDLSLVYAPRYKLVIFLNCYNMTDAQRSMVESLKNSGRILVFCYAPGYFNGNTMSEQNMESLLGFNMTVSTSETRLGTPTVMTNDHPLGTAIINAGVLEYSPTVPLNEYGKRIWIDDVNASRIGYDSYDPSRTLMAIRDMGSWKSVYCHNPNMPEDMLRELGRYAGVNIYLEKGTAGSDAFHINRSYITIHANGTGSRTVHFPHPVKVFDAVTNLLLASNVTSYSTSMTSGDTLILRYTDPSVPHWIDIFSDGFEGNFDKWTDGGVTDWDRTTVQKKTDSYSAHAGSADNDLISDNINAAGYSLMIIKFWYMDDDIDDDDNVMLQLYNGTSYIDRFELSNTSPEDTWHYCEITIDKSGSDTQFFIPNFRIKFEGTSIDSGENLWIDDVVIAAKQ